MILTLAVCDRDLPQAIRIMRWIGWLSLKNDNSMLQESCLLVLSRRAAARSAHKELCWLASKIFGQARCHIPDTEHEVGWPGSSNWMFSRALEHVEHYFHDDIFFLEPDGMPLYPTWYDQIQAEWAVARENGKSFMGNSVPHTVPHMTGIAVYGRDWRSIAPTLVECPDHDAFDCYGAPLLLPHAHFTPLIQHVFRRSDLGWEVPSLGILDRRAVLFHQDKKGKLLPMLDAAFHNGECSDHPLFGYRTSYNPEVAMRKFYYSGNATKPQKAHGYTFVFDKLEPHGGAIPGVFTTEFEAEQNALFEITSNPTNGITEIDQAEWERLTKKKWAHPLLNTSKPSSKISNEVGLLPTPSRSPATLVAEPVASSNPSIEAGIVAKPEIKDINDVLKTGPVVPAQPRVDGQKPKSQRPRKE